MVDSEFFRPEGFLYPWSFGLHALQDYDLKYRYKTVNFFLDPFSGVRVKLPSQSTIPYSYTTRPFFFQKVVASSVPITTSLSDHHHHQLINSTCLVGGLCAAGRYLAFCRPTDKSWTLIDPVLDDRRRNILDMEIIDGKLYAATRNAPQFLIVYDLQILHEHADDHGNAGPPGSRYIRPPERLVMLHPRPVPSLSSNTNGGVLYYTEYEDTCLAKDPTSDQLFMIFHNTSLAYEEDPIIPRSIRGRNYVIPPQTQGFRVFKLEHDDNGSRWVAVEDLADLILFVSKANNKFISASSLGAGHHKTDEENCIYFAFDNLCFSSPSMGRHFGVFSLTSIKSFIVPNDHPRTTLFHTQTVWFSPNIKSS